MTGVSYYGCTASGHSEFTCLSAFYTGPRKYRRIAAWCPTCRVKYRFPGPPEASKLEGKTTIPKGNGMNQKDAALIAGALRSAALNTTAMQAAGLNPADVATLADEFSPSVED